jgi:hypothetical protein
METKEKLQKAVKAFMNCYPDERLQFSADLMSGIKFDGSFLPRSENESERVNAEEYHRLDLQAFLFMREFIEELGDAEHTSDWDPYLIITLMDGKTKLETLNGYWAAEIRDDSLCIEAPDIDGDEDLEGYEEIEKLRVNNEYQIYIYAIKEITIGR